MNTTTLTLPEHWAPYLIYGDASGLDIHEADEINEVLAEWIECGEIADAVPLDVGDERIETAWHDARSAPGMPGLFATCLNFTFRAP